MGFPPFCFFLFYDEEHLQFSALFLGRKITVLNIRVVLVINIR